MATPGDDLIYGTSGDDLIHADEGNDTVYGLGGDDTLSGGAGSDTLFGGDGNDRLSGDGSIAFDNGTTVDILYGGAGDDFLFAGYGDLVDGGDGFDILALSYLGTNHGIEGDTATLHHGEPLVAGSGTILSIERIGDLVLTNFNDKMVIGDQADPATVSAWDGDDILIGQSMSITMYGGNGNDLLGGSVSDDMIYGDNGDDRIIGYLGADQLWGGAGADRFIFTSIADSGPGYAWESNDFIRDWEAIDKIDLSAIDADPITPGDQAFTLSKVAFGFPAGAQPPGSVVIGGFGGTLFVSVYINGGLEADIVIDLWSAAGESALTNANLIF